MAQTTTLGKSLSTETPRLSKYRWLRSILQFLEIEASGGIVLMVATLIALFLANSRWETQFAEIWQTRVSLAFGHWELNKPLLLWINDGLMTIFFFVVGLEIKRELVAGELRDRRKAALPVIAALGGMILPAVVYLLVLRGGQGQSAWAIPTATDIAFAIGFLALLGRRVPFSLKILLLTLAIADDIGAILIIATFYSADISFAALGLGAAGFLLVWLLNLLGVRRVGVYIIVGAGIWFAFLKSGVHPTVSGVLLGLLTPATAWLGEGELLEKVSAALGRLGEVKDPEKRAEHQQTLGRLQHAALEGISPLDRLQSGLHQWVAFGIMPLFALANAGVRVDFEGVQSPVAIAVAVGLLLGKPLGIVLASWVAVKMGLASLPSGVNWNILLGAGFLAGIGFTMSLFIAQLALQENLLSAAKVGVLGGSAISALAGFCWLFWFLPRKDISA